MPEPEPEPAGVVAGVAADVRGAVAAEAPEPEPVAAEVPGPEPVAAGVRAGVASEVTEPVTVEPAEVTAAALVAGWVAAEVPRLEPVAAPGSAAEAADAASCPALACGLVPPEHQLGVIPFQYCLPGRRRGLCPGASAWRRPAQNVPGDLYLEQQASGTSDI